MTNWFMYSARLMDVVFPSVCRPFNLVSIWSDNSSFVSSASIHLFNCSQAFCPSAGVGSLSGGISAASICSASVPSKSSVEVIEDSGVVADFVAIPPKSNSVSPVVTRRDDFDRMHFQNLAYFPGGPRKLVL
jgi:hypothetical protein